MRIPIFQLLIIIGFILLLSCRSPEIQNQWAAETINIDGNSSDWTDTSLFYIEGSNIVMGLKNDAEYLYIMLRLNNPLIARKVNMFGITIWLAAKEKKNKDYGIHYTGSVRLNQYLNSPIDSSKNFSQKRMERIKRRRAMRSEPGTITVIKKGEKISLPEKNSKGPSAASDFQNGAYCFEYRIPLPVKAELAKELSLGIELGGPSSEEMSAMKQRQGQRGMRGGRGGMRGDRPPEGMEGGRDGQGMGERESGGDRASREELMQKQEEWINILLAQKNDLRKN